jgi:hypothetical protein
MSTGRDVYDPLVSAARDVWEVVVILHYGPPRAQAGEGGTSLSSGL